MIGERENELIHISVKVTSKQKDALDKIRDEKDRATFSDAVRYALRKGIEAIEMN